MSDEVLAPGAEARRATPERIALDDIKAPIRAELAHFADYFRDAMRSDVRLLRLVTRYVLRKKGKQIRPILVLLSAKVCGRISETTYRGAALVELLHTATLTHDDVVDDAERRRGQISVSALWRDKVAVLFGDFLLSRGLLLALETNDYELLHTMSDAVKRMSEGELLQIEKSRLLNIDEDSYFEIISNKTASLIAACTVTGAVSVGASDEAVGTMRDLGENLGIAFQIRDDLFEYDPKDVGKPIGIDIADRKMTLPLIHALRVAPKSERRTAMRIMRSKRKRTSEIRQLRNFVYTHGGMDYAISSMRRHAERARTSLLEFPPTPARDALEDLIQYTITRQK